MKASRTLFLASLFFAAIPAQATVVLTNLSGPDSLAANFANTTGRRADVFTVGAQDIAVDSVTLRLSGYNTITGDIARLGFFLDDGSGTNTGAQVGDYLISPTSSSGSTGSFTFTPSGTLQLAADNTYWMTLEYLAGDFFQWVGSSPAVSPTGTGATYVQAKFSGNGGASYANATGALKFQIDGTLVPEPSRMLLLFCGIGTVLLSRRRAQAV